MFFNLPTLLTWARIVAIPLIVGVFYLQIGPGLQNLAATVLFVVVAITDWADGYLARRLNMTSSFGAFLDPVADKFLVCAALLVLVHLNRVQSRSPLEAAAPALAVENATKISPDPFPDVDPVRAMPIPARRAKRFN